jgi:hypothetical protein
MARDIYTASLVEDPPTISSFYNYQNDYHPHQYDSQSLVNRPAASFVVKNVVEESKKRTWEICMEVDGQMEREGKERKRRLVSLFEANEVAKRVAGVGRAVGGRQVVVNGGLVDGEGKPDVVSEWVELL